MRNFVFFSEAPSAGGAYDNDDDGNNNDDGDDDVCQVNLADSAGNGSA